MSEKAASLSVVNVCLFCCSFYLVRVLIVVILAKVI